MRGHSKESSIKLFQKEKLLGRVNDRATTQLFISPELLRGTESVETVFGMVMHETGHTASFKAGLFSPTVRQQKQRRNTVATNS